MWHSVRSFFQRLHMEFTRVLDHSWRRYRGLPLMSNSQITPQLFVGGQYTHSGFRRLQERGITAIVSMRSQLPVDPSKYPNMRFLHLPTVDQQPPTLEQFRVGSQFIQKQIDDGGKVYVHCLHGEGRGPSMATAYLVSTGLTLEDALAQVKRARSFVQPTKVQMERLREFEEWQQTKML